MADDHQTETNGGAQSAVPARPTRVLLVDDEDRFRQSLAERLRMRGLDVTDVENGRDAIRRLRLRRPDVVVLDRKMPGLQGEEVLREIKKMAPEIQVIMLTGHACVDSATAAGRLDAFAYLAKPCDPDELIGTIEAAHVERNRAMARHEIPRVDRRSFWTWLRGTNNWRPGMMLVGAALFAAMALLPVPDGMVRLLGAPKTGQMGDAIAGYANYGKMKEGETIAEQYSRESKRKRTVDAGDGQTAGRPLSAEETGRAAMVMLGILIVAALFWATGALPIGITALLVGLLMYASACSRRTPWPRRSPRTPSSSSSASSPSRWGSPRPVSIGGSVSCSSARAAR